MAYIRTIKASFFTSDDIVSLSPLARLLYIGLWTESDREGRLVWRPGNFKLRLLPGDACDINGLCNELVESGLVIPYVAEGKNYAEIPTFKNHQSINVKERKSVIPERDWNAIQTRELRDDCATTTGRDEKYLSDKERKGNREERIFPSQPEAVIKTLGEIAAAAQTSGNGGDDEF